MAMDSPESSPDKVSSNKVKVPSFQIRVPRGASPTLSKDSLTALLAAPRSFSWTSAIMLTYLLGPLRFTCAGTSLAVIVAMSSNKGVEEPALTGRDLRSCSVWIMFSGTWTCTWKTNPDLGSTHKFLSVNRVEEVVAARFLETS